MALQPAFNQPFPRQASAWDVSAPAANTAAVVQYIAQPGVQHCVSRIDWSYSGTGTLSGGNLQIWDGAGNVVFNLDITALGAGFVTFEPLLGTQGNFMQVVLAAGGANVSGKLNVGHFTIVNGLMTTPPSLNFSKSANSQLLSLVA